MENSLQFNNIRHYTTLDSTNAVAEKWHTEERPPEGSVVLADHQNNGKGLGTNGWESESGSNLLLSTILYPDFLPAHQQFMLNKVLSLAVHHCVAGQLPQHQVLIKWPNDVYVGEKKIAGILTRNIIRGSTLEATVAGVGLNVNQTNFSKEIPNPISLKMVSGKDHDLRQVLQSLLEALEHFYGLLRTNHFYKIDEQYLRELLNYDKPAAYQAGQKEFTGRIIGVDAYGHLMMTVDEETKTFDMKEIVFKY
ncbi:MAG TPA: biotin--[acetyl-CoA-carboxylase] ligase [Bacteroidales bacterium]|nr:biotin--[acetyl-CoA-carboxylase] ligase [Bacteroidales bacterium]